jgi:hypothetical protein
MVGKRRSKRSLTNGVGCTNRNDFNLLLPYVCCNALNG